MAEKNWLIRTKNNQILGPSTKEKIIELIEKGSLTGEDEITSGNGYWFWIKEEDLLDKYIYGEELQTFNPISEAESVLTTDRVAMPIMEALNIKSSEQTLATPPSSKAGVDKPKSNDSLFPENEDLEYPDIDIDLSSSEDKTGEIDLGDRENIEKSDEDQNPEEDITRLDLSDLSEQIAAMKTEVSALSEGDKDKQERKDLDQPKSENSSCDDYSSGLAKKKTLFRKKMTKIENSDDIGSEEDLSSSSRVKATKQRNDKYLFFIFILAFFLIAIVFYYYRLVLNKPIPLVGISEAHAQTITSLPITISKKKTSLRPKI